MFQIGPSSGGIRFLLKNGIEMRGFTRFGGALLVLVIVAACDQEDGTVQEQMNSMNDRASDAAGTAKDGAAGMVDSAKDRAIDAAGEASAKAQADLDGAVQNIKDKRFDLAHGALDKLDGMKGSLPAGLQDKISQARAAIDAAKTAGQVKSAADNVGGAVDKVKNALPGLYK